MKSNRTSAALLNVRTQRGRGDGAALIIPGGISMGIQRLFGGNQIILSHLRKVHPSKISAGQRDFMTATGILVVLVVLEVRYALLSLKKRVNLWSGLPGGSGALLS